jgi:GNAT superfamily N-acetyltransferase
MLSEDAIIEPVGVRDMLAISQMTQANMTGVDPHFTKMVRRPLNRWLANLSLPFYFMFSGRGFKAVSQGRILGFAFLALRQRSGYVFNVNVNRPYRRQGVAQLLMHHLEQVTRERQRHWIALQVDESNLPARRLYDKLGYRAYHPDLLRHENPTAMPLSLAGGVELRPVPGHQGRQQFRRYQAEELRIGDSWAAGTVVEYDLLPPNAAYSQCLVQRQAIGCAWLMLLGGGRQAVASLALRPDFWGHFSTVSLVQLLLDEVESRPPQQFDVYLASSQHHQAAQPLLEGLGFRPALQPRMLMLKALI